MGMKMVKSTMPGSTQQVVGQSGLLQVRKVVRQIRELRIFQANQSV